MEMSLASSAEVTNAQARRRRRIDGDEVERRARRAFHFVQLGENSAGRQALDGASLATGDQKTKKALEDFSRRPAVPRDPSVASTAQFEPEELFLLAQDLFLKNVLEQSPVASALR